MSTPLPDRRPLVANSAWVAARPGLADAAAVWQRTLPTVRRDLATEATALARPRLWIDTIGSLARTSWRVTTAAAPDAPIALLSASAAAIGLPVAPPGRGRAIVARAERLVRTGGPAYVKLGQFIATARGLLPDEWVEAFSWCRDEVPPLPPGVAAHVIEEELGGAGEVFARFDPEPFAAASIGQVHHAVLRDGTAVVVKIQRPGLRERFTTDIETMALVATLAEWAHPAARTANLTGFIELFATLVLEELDFRLEALNLVELAAAFEDSGLDSCAFPRPFPGLVTNRVLVMEHVPGVRYTDAADVYGTNLNGELLLRLAIKGVLETTLVYGIFHGDLHAGNVLIDAGDSFALVDFGICGRLDATQRDALVRFLVAFAAMDPLGQLETMREFGAIPSDADLDPLAAQLQVEIDRLPSPERGGLTFDRLGEGLGGVLRVLAANGFRLPSELVLFFKNLLYLAGFASAVAPDADLLGEIQPVLAYFQSKYAVEMATITASAEVA